MDDSAPPPRTILKAKTVYVDELIKFRQTQFLIEPVPGTWLPLLSFPPWERIFVW